MVLTLCLCVVCVCVWISEQTENFTLYITKRLFCTTEVDSVYCAVGTESLYKTDTFHL